MEKLTFDQRQECLKGDSSLRKKWKNISQIGTLLKKTLAHNEIASKQQRIEQEIFDLFNEKEDNLYDFSTRDKRIMINGSMRIKRRYNNIDTYKFIKSILSIRGIEKIHTSTYQNIIECIQEMRNLKEVLNTSKPQSDPSYEHLQTQKILLDPPTLEEQKKRIDDLYAYDPDEPWWNR